MKIKEVQKITDLSAANIRFYEKEGLIHPLRDESNNYRNYRDEDVRRLEEIKKLRLLGISIPKIKQLYNGQITVSELMNERLAEVLEEQKNLELTKSACENALKRHIELDNLNELTIDDRKREWQVRLAVIMQEDTYRETLTRQQFNTFVSRWLTWGFCLCSLLSIALHSFAYSYTESIRAQGVFPGDGMTKNPFHYVTILMYGIIFATIIIGILIYCTSNAMLLLVLFHVSLLLNTIFLSICFYWKETITLLMSRNIPFVFISLAVYALVIGFLMNRKKPLFTKMRYSILSWGIYVTVITIIMIFRNGITPLTLIPVGIAALFSLFLIIEWTVSNMDHEHFTKYDVYCLATNITNIVAFVISRRGYYGSSNIFGR